MYSLYYLFWNQNSRTFKDNIFFNDNNPVFAFLNCLHTVTWRNNNVALRILSALRKVVLANCKMLKKLPHTQSSFTGMFSLKGGRAGTLWNEVSAHTEVAANIYTSNASFIPIPKKLVKKLAGTDQVLFVTISLPTCLPMFANMFTNMFANTPTWVCQHKFAYFSLSCEDRAARPFYSLFVAYLFLLNFYAL